MTHIAATGLSAALHRGHFIYHSKQHCLAVLSAVEASKPEWFDAHCAHFLRLVEEVPTYGEMKATYKMHPLIVLEGLDGSGKTTVATELTRRLPASLIRTPHPKFEHTVREKFRNLPEPISRAFYCAANYLAAHEAQILRKDQPVLFDRWWGSTCSMALGMKAGTSANLPAADSDIYRWPLDLPRPTLGIVLDVDENIRSKRAQLRGDMKSEEHALAAKEDLRRAVKVAYERMDMYTFINEPTWPLTVNAIVDLLEKNGAIASGTVHRCTKEEIATVRPY